MRGRQVLPETAGEEPPAAPGEPPDETEPRPSYARALRLRHTRLARWQAVLLFDVVLVVGVLLALAEVASAWAPVVLPLVVALVVKAYDEVAGLAGPVPSRPRGRSGSGRRVG